MHPEQDPTLEVVCPPQLLAQVVGAKQLASRPMSLKDVGKTQTAM